MLRALFGLLGSRAPRGPYEIAVSNPKCRCRGIAEAELDGAPVDPHAIPLVDDGGTHHLRVVLGDGERIVRRRVRPGTIAPA